MNNYENNFSAGMKFLVQHICIIYRSVEFYKEIDYISIHFHQDAIIILLINIYALLPGNDSIQ